MIDFKKLTRESILLFDGAMGTMLQAKGLKAGDLPEAYNITHPELVTEIHREYVNAGADFVSTNTFQANDFKIGSEYSVEEVIKAGVACAKNSGAKYTALDIGPLGQLMEPMGTVSFNTAYEIFKKQVTAGSEAGADVIIIETLSDLYEAKAAVLAAKENCSLPVICTMTFQEDMRTFIGCDALTATVFLQDIGVDALGVNCSLGPRLLMPIVETTLKYSQVPVIVQANAGLPELVDDKTVYRLPPEEYAAQVFEMLKKGVKIIGGCCGTDPRFIKALKNITADFKPVEAAPCVVSACTSGIQTVILDDKITEIGERLNPTGKKKMKEALRGGDMNYLINEAITQAEAGAQVLDVNVGLPEIDECAVLTEAVKTIQGVVNVPLQIDSSDAEAIEAAVRVYNGKPIINSVNGKAEEMAKIFPIAKKYGALLVCLTLDHNGIPATAEGRLNIARNICSEAVKYGIKKENLIIDCLVLTASAQQEQVIETIKAVGLVKKELGVKTVLGVSNVSFGLPARETLNAVFLASAFGAGLDCAIINPFAEKYREVISAFRVINGEDRNSGFYINNYGGETAHIAAAVASTGLSLREIIEKGRKEEASAAVKSLLGHKKPLEIIDNEFIPALDTVGHRFEKGEIFLPQLMLSAQAVQNGFEVLRGQMGSDEKPESKGKVILATVKGDIHDIGKNIVRMMLESYGYEVIDLGKDVSPEDILESAEKHEVKLIGLSALMTTTVKSMKETIALIKSRGMDCEFMVGGAVLNEEYTLFVGAEHYARDAMEGVNIANRVLGV